jgi:hypothetical protein
MEKHILCVPLDYIHAFPGYCSKFLSFQSPSFLSNKRSIFGIFLQYFRLSLAQISQFPTAYVKTGFQRQWSEAIGGFIAKRTTALGRGIVLLKIGQRERTPMCICAGIWNRIKW